MSELPLVDATGIRGTLNPPKQKPEKLTKKYPNLDKVRDTVASALTNGIEINGERSPVNLKMINTYLNKKGFNSIESFVNSMEKAYGLHDPAINGLLWNWGNEVQAVAYRLIDPSKSYDEHYKDMMIKSQLYELENPKMSMGAEFVGGMASGIGGGLKLQKAIQKIPMKGLQNPTGSAIGTGVVEGGIAGYGQDSDEFVSAKRLVHALAGAGLGGGTAGVMANFWGVFQSLKNQYQKFTRSTPPSRGDDSVFKGLQKDNLIEETDDGVSIAPAMAKHKELTEGSEGMPVMGMDLGRNMRAYGSVVLDTPSSAQNVGRDILENRQDEMLNRFTDVVHSGTNLPRDAGGALAENTMRKTLNASRQMYNKAYEKYPVIDEESGKELYEFLSDPTVNQWFQGAYIEGADLARLERVTDPLAPEIPFPKPVLNKSGKQRKDSNGQPLYEEMTGPFSIKQLDYVKRGFSDYIQKLSEAGSLQKSKKAEYFKQLKIYRDMLDEVAPEYGKARKKYAIGIDADDAYKLGERVLSERPAVIKRMFDKKDKNALSSGEKFFYRLSAMEKIIDMMEKKGIGANLAEFYRKYPQQKQRIEILFGDDEGFQKFKNMVNAEKETALSFKTLGNSVTEPKREARASMMEEPTNPVLAVGEDVARYGTTIGTLSGLQRAFDKKIGIPEGTAERAGDTLFETDPVKLEKKLKRIVKEVPERIKKKKGYKGKAGVVATGLLNMPYITGLDALDEKRK